MAASRKSVQGLEDFGEGQPKSKKIADHALMFMIRGINAAWKLPVSYYFVQSATKADRLKSLIKEIISTIHSKTQFRVLATVCDQMQTNKSALKQLCQESNRADEFVFTVNDSVIYPLFDPPHLIKGFRNHFLGKDVNFNGKIAKWQDILNLYNLDGAPDGKICPKLTNSHLFPKGRDKMKVKFATQIFSRSVYAGLQFATNCKAMDATGTAEFVLFMDKLFNSMNGTRKSKKPLNGPLTDKTDHLNFWATAKVLLRNLTFKIGDDTVANPPTIENTILTITNMQSIWNVMKRDLEFKFLLTRTLNQDCIENTFGVIRGLCGQNHRPTFVQFSSAFKTCLINNLMSNSNSTNCEDDGTVMLTGFLDSFTTQYVEPVSPHHRVLNLDNIDVIVDSGYQQSIKNRDVLKIFRNNTSAYMAGFICKYVLKTNCENCANYLLTTESTERHTLIIFKEFDSNRRLMYPKQNIIDLVDTNKDIIFRNFLNIIDRADLFYALYNMLEVNIDCCEEHNNHLNIGVRQCLVHIMIKYIIYQINRKLCSKDLRPNTIIDNFIKDYGPR